MMKWFLVVLMVTLVAPVARAAEPSEADKNKARRLVEVAQKLIAQKQYSKAIETFKRAYRYWQNYQIDYNIALVYLEIGVKVKAAEYLRRYKRKATPAEIDALPQPLRRLEREVATLRVRSPEADATIWVDDKRVGKGKVELLVWPGPHKVELRRGGKVLITKMLNVTGGAVVVFAPETIKIPGSQVQPSPTDKRKKIHWGWFVTLTTVAVAAGAVVAGTGVKTLQLGDEYDQNPDDKDLQAEGRMYKLVTNVMIGVTAAAALSAAVIAFFTRWSSKEKAAESGAGEVTVQPGVAPGGATLTLQFDF